MNTKDEVVLKPPNCDHCHKEMSLVGRYGIPSHWACVHCFVVKEGGEFTAFTKEFKKKENAK